MRVLLTIIIIFFISSLVVTGQALKLIHADSHRSFVNSDGVLVRSLEGNVFLKKDTLSMYCTRAILKEGFRKIDLNENVRFQTPTKQLTTSKATFYDRTNFAQLFHNIVYLDSSQQLNTEYAEIFFDQNTFYAKSKVRLLRFIDESYIDADSGRANFESKSYIFTGNAYYHKPDSLNDPLEIWSDKFELQEHPDKIVMKAVGNVVFNHGELIANCDSAIYIVEAGFIKLLNDPRAYWDINEMIGDTLILYFNAENNEPEKLVISGHAEVFSPLDSLKTKENYLAGKKIISKFDGQDLKWIEAQDNAVSRYYIADSKGKAQGLNNSSADTIRLFLKENEVDSVSIIGGVEGKYSPTNEN